MCAVCYDSGGGGLNNLFDLEIICSPEWQEGGGGGSRGWGVGRAWGLADLQGGFL